jgi:hypothetical protein
MIGVMDHAEGVAQVQFPRYRGYVRGREPRKGSNGCIEIQKHRMSQSISKRTRGDEIDGAQREKEVIGEFIREEESRRRKIEGERPEAEEGVDALVRGLF